MKILVPIALLLLAGCGAPQPKFSNPVVVNADNAAIHEAMDETSRVLVIADKGDTLEFDGTPTSDLCRVKPDAHYHRFPHEAKAGYINRKYLTLTPAVLAKNEAGSPSGIPKDKPAHLNKKK